MRLLFTTNDVGVGAKRVFVGRDRERAAFDRAVEAHYHATKSGTVDVNDVIRERRHVQVFYGAGGIGKSTLSKAFEARHGGHDAQLPMNWAPWDPPFKKSVSVRLDLAGEGGVDLEQMLLQIRAGVASLGRPMPAFDIAFTRYWEHVHPDKNLDDFLRQNGVLRRVSDSLQLTEQMQAGLAEVGQALGGSSTLVSAGTQLARVLIRKGQDRRNYNHAVQKCRLLLPILQSDLEVENLGYYAHLLAWDLDQVATRSSFDFHVAVFIDTFEDVNLGNTRRREQLLQRLVWLMPNVLFIITGRNRLDWAETASAGSLDWSGATAWPGLADQAQSEPKQHLVEQLDRAQCEKFLAMRLTSNGEPLIPEPLRNEIAVESQGYPLYLDLATARYLQILGSGNTPVLADFTGGLPGLVSRLLRDLDIEERRLVRVLSLLESFDINLAMSTAELASDSTLRRLVRRPIVEFDANAALPFSIHRLLRRAVQSTEGEDSVSSEDWRRFAKRAFDALGRRFEAANREGDRAIANSVLNQALSLAYARDLDLDWCSEAATVFVEDSVWNFSVRPLTGTALDSSAAQLAESLLEIAQQQAASRRSEGVETRGQIMSTDLRETLRALNELLEQDDLEGEARALALFYAAETLRELGDVRIAEELLRAIPRGDPQTSRLAAKGLVHLLRRQGRFRELKNLISNQERDALWLQMNGTLLWSQGLLDEAIEEYRESWRRFTAAGHTGNADELTGSIAFVCGLRGVRDADSLSAVDRGVISLGNSRSRWSYFMAQLGAALMEANGHEAISARLRQLGEDGQETGFTSIYVYAQFCVCLNAVLSGSPEQVELERLELARRVDPVNFMWLIEIVNFWAQYLVDPRQVERDADWLQGDSTAKHQWSNLIAERRSALGRLTS